VSAGFFFRSQVEAVLASLESMGTGALAIILAFVLGYAGMKAIERYLLIRFLRMVRIGVAELRAMLDAGSPLVLFDVRSSLAREAEPRMIPGAISVELSTVERMLEHVPPDAEVVVYCS
jgi:hypothetical protein